MVTSILLGTVCVRRTVACVRRTVRLSVSGMFAYYRRTCAEVVKYLLGMRKSESACEG